MSMLTREEAKRYGEYVGKLDTMYCTLSGDYDPKDVVAAVFNARHYDKTRKGLARTLLDAGVGYIPKDSNPKPGEVAGLGILDERGRNLQAGRYILPVRDYYSNPVALVGWYPDKRKYMTTAGELFSKAKLFYGLEQYPFEEGAPLFLCEGMFDTLAIRSCGLPALGVMGVEMSDDKHMLLEALAAGHRVVGVPDQDEAGENVARNDKWGLLELGGCYLRWDKESLIDGHSIKDADDLINFVGERAGAGILRSAARQETKRVVLRLQV